MRSKYILKLNTVPDDPFRIPPHLKFQVTIFIRDPYAAHYLRDEKITEISFVGTVGGLLGLFLGFSFLSVVEMLYLFLGVRNKEQVDRRSEDNTGVMEHFFAG